MAEKRYNIYRSTGHWRYAMARPRLAFFDPRLVFFIILFVFHIRWWMFALLVFAVAGFTGACYLNYSLENVLRFFRSQLVGRSVRLSLIRGFDPWRIMAQMRLGVRGQERPLL